MKRLKGENRIPVLSADLLGLSLLAFGKFLENYTVAVNEDAGIQRTWDKTPLLNSLYSAVGVVDLIFEKETFIVADVAPEGGGWPR